MQRDGGVKQKWRPSLAMVIGGALAGTLGISFIGVLILREARVEFGLTATTLTIGAVIAILTTTMGLVMVRLLLRPVRALAGYAREVRLGREEPSDPPLQYGTRELRDMAISVLEMAEALRAREATMRAYSDHVTHELKSPVSAMVAAAELLQDRDLSAEDQRLVAQIAGAAGEMDKQLNLLRDMARARSSDYRGQTRLSDLVAELQARHPALSLEVRASSEDVPLSQDGITLILDHLLQNALQAGAKQVRLWHENGHVHIHDDGPGIPSTNAERVFEPFYTTRREGGGTGMGLAIVASVLAAHGGQIKVLPGAKGAHLRLSFRRPLGTARS